MFTQIQKVRKYAIILEKLKCSMVTLNGLKQKYHLVIGKIFFHRKQPIY